MGKRVEVIDIKTTPYTTPHVHSKFTVIAQIGDPNVENLRHIVLTEDQIYEIFDIASRHKLSSGLNDKLAYLFGRE